MKKSLVLMAMAGVALASCVNDVADVAQNQEQKKVKIAFDSPMTMTNAESRANYYGEIGNIQYTEGGSTYTYPRAEDFRIFAIEHAELYAGGWINSTTQKAFNFNDEAISFDSELDGWAPLKPESDEVNKYYYYWPSDAYLSFAAVSPADMEQGNDFSYTYGETGLSLTNFVVPSASVTVTTTGEDENKTEVVTNSYNQFDLLFSKRALNCTSDDMVQAAGKYSGIPIHFQHALSSIRFSLDKENVEENVYLKEIRLYGVKNQGDFAEGIGETSSDWTKYDRSESGSNVNPHWTPKGDLLDEEHSYCAFYGRVEFKSTPQYVKDLIQEENQEIIESTPAGTTPQLNNSVCNLLLLMPQELQQYASGKEQDADGNVISAQEGAVLYVRYEIGGEDRERWVALRGKQGNENDTNGPAKIVYNWEVGVRYTYRLVISAGTIENDKIYFAPQTESWKDVTAIIVNL